MPDTNYPAPDEAIALFKVIMEKALKDIASYLGHDRCIEILSRERTRVLCEQIEAERERKEAEQ
jgi:hypothetical protein